MFWQRTSRRSMEKDTRSEYRQLFVSFGNNCVNRTFSYLIGTEITVQTVYTDINWCPIKRRRTKPSINSNILLRHALLGSFVNRVLVKAWENGRIDWVEYFMCREGVMSVGWYQYLLIQLGQIGREKLLYDTKTLKNYEKHINRDAFIIRYLKQIIRLFRKKRLSLVNEAWRT